MGDGRDGIYPRKTGAGAVRAEAAQAEKYLPSALRATHRQFSRAGLSPFFVPLISLIDSTLPGLGAGINRAIHVFSKHVSLCRKMTNRDSPCTLFYVESDTEE